MFAVENEIVASNKLLKVEKNSLLKQTKSVRSSKVIFQKHRHNANNTKSTAQS